MWRRRRLCWQAISSTWSFSRRCVCWWLYICRCCVSVRHARCGCLCAPVVSLTATCWSQNLRSWSEMQRWRRSTSNIIMKTVKVSSSECVLRRSSDSTRRCCKMLPGYWTSRYVHTRDGTLLCRQSPTCNPHANSSKGGRAEDSGQKVLELYEKAFSARVFRANCRCRVTWCRNLIVNVAWNHVSPKFWLLPTVFAEVSIFGWFVWKSWQNGRSARLVRVWHNLCRAGCGHLDVQLFLCDCADSIMLRKCHKRRTSKSMLNLSTSRYTLGCILQDSEKQCTRNSYLDYFALTHRIAATRTWKLKSTLRSVAPPRKWSSAKPERNKPRHHRMQVNCVRVLPQSCRCKHIWVREWFSRHSPARSDFCWKDKTALFKLPSRTLPRSWLPKCQWPWRCEQSTRYPRVWCSNYYDTVLAWIVDALMSSLLLSRLHKSAVVLSNRLIPKRHDWLLPTYFPSLFVCDRSPLHALPKSSTSWRRISRLQISTTVLVSKR